MFADDVVFLLIEWGVFGLCFRALCWLLCDGDDQQ
jgi:hypothetical protein